jgi:23S rRNA (adenine2030-N6)-methyltransferase
MFSYRHAFHAGNHADVLKHTVLIAVLRHMTQKDTALNVFDTHAGAGLYRLDGDYAQTSGEAADGFLRLISDEIHPVTLKEKEHIAAIKIAAFASKQTTLPAALQDYVDVVASFNKGTSHMVYPGSPFIIQHLLQGRARDRLKLFELHPTDAKTLRANIAQLNAGRLITVHQEDGFEGLKKFLPPPSRRSLVLCDPSYELKTDYGRVMTTMSDAMNRFTTGTYMVWYPIIPRPEAHDLPKKLKALAQRAGRPWLNANLTVKSSKLTVDDAGETVRPGLPASGVFIVNTPHTLKATLTEALAFAVKRMAQDKNASFDVDCGG